MNKPLASRREKNINIAAFNNESNGRQFITYCIDKSYKKGEEWQKMKITLNAEECSILLKQLTDLEAEIKHTTK